MYSKVLDFFIFFTISTLFAKSYPAMTRPMKMVNEARNRASYKTHAFDAIIRKMDF